MAEAREEEDDDDDDDGGEEKEGDGEWLDKEGAGGASLKMQVRSIIISGAGCGHAYAPPPFSLCNQGGRLTMAG